MFRRKRKASDFGDEIQSHIQLEAERLREQGLSEEDARATARRAFGNITQAQERFYESGRWLWWDHVWQDLRFTLRTLRRDYGFSIVAVLILALGIGANIAVFSVVNTILLRPLPFRDPEQLVRIVGKMPKLANRVGPIQRTPLRISSSRTILFSLSAATSPLRGLIISSSLGAASQCLLRAFL